ncbi:AmmeMemoRadiSam system radical SAM enzyme [Sedimenticola thiotaurini]|uniref:Pyruvate formate lyase-activating protein n=1 Tax=Sedimenticola thiotaurini TaxID=1543721 RepID=A0A0F7JY04_9GAMM|nr:AmmeMemoRadiSam system radical SAM enzyme [Sedimenticola thiotaurini]AKH19553.1 pyruvate formate lyase-activating protein [Sedimenticola thiotaurini]
MQLKETDHPTIYWHTLEDGRVQCDLCPRECKLREGQQGLCFVRACHDGKVVLTTYGRSSGFCVDPIEKKPLNHYLPGTPVLSFGTAGCNLSCRFCQNWDMSKSREMDTLADAASPETIAATAKRLGCRSIAFTYNDPVIFMEYAVDTAIACHAQDIRTVAVTAGYISPEPRVEFFRHVDAANVDLKSFNERFYHKLTGAHLQPVLDTLVYLKEQTRVWFELTTLLIPGENDSDEELDRMTRWVVANLGPDVPMHFSAFHPDWKMRDYPPTPPATLSRARQIALSNGVHHAYTGNVHDSAGGSTYCSSCGKLLIQRDWYELGEWHLTPDGRCAYCGETCAGVFEATPGDWGARRMPVRLDQGM